MSISTIRPNSTTIICMENTSAYGYLPMRDDNDNISCENIFTNILNVLDYIPVVSIISGIARIIFAGIQLLNTSSNNQEALDHYKNHLVRGCIASVPLIGNSICALTDFINTRLSSPPEVCSS